MGNHLRQNTANRFGSCWINLIAVVAFIGFFLMPNAQAAPLRIFNSSNDQALIEKLKEKGILSDQDIEEVKKEQEVQKKQHSMNFTARAQFMFAYNSAEDGVAGDTNSFNVRRLRFQVDGYLYQYSDFKFEFYADRLTGFGLRDVWVGYKKYPFFRIRLGQFKTPFSRQRVTSSSKLQMIERSPVQVFYPGRELGIEISGKNLGGFFDYGVSLVGGGGFGRKFASTDNGNFVMMGRVAVHPFGQIKFSEGDVSYTDNFRFELVASALFAPSQVAFGEKSTDNIFETFSAYGIADLDVAPLGLTMTYGGELTVHYKGFSFTGEGYYATFSPNQDEVGKILTTRRDISSYGFFGQAGYFVIPGYLELTGRYSQLDLDRQAVNATDVKAIAGGFNYFVKKSHALKFQVNYVREIRNAAFENSHLVMLSFQAKY